MENELIKNLIKQSNEYLDLSESYYSKHIQINKQIKELEKTNAKIYVGKYLKLQHKQNTKYLYVKDINYDQGWFLFGIGFIIINGHIDNIPHKTNVYYDDIKNGKYLVTEITKDDFYYIRNKFINDLIKIYY